jgi:hypothetical protein
MIFYFVITILLVSHLIVGSIPRFYFNNHIIKKMPVLCQFYLKQKQKQKENFGLTLLIISNKANT